MKAQTIQIDSIFTSDGEIFPFSPNDTIYGLSISGSVVLHSDTSLVRVILTDNSGQEWMVYEAYPMIAEDSVFDIIEECDETCFLNECVHHSLRIQLVDAEIHISFLTYSQIWQENLSILQDQAKRNKDLVKVQSINHYISSKGWEWIANTTGLVNMYYLEKVQMFDVKYNLLGRDYYSGGVFYSARHENIPKYTETTIIPSFDWRKKHNANLSSSNYFDYNPDVNEVGNGWMTGIRSQTCGSCSAFAGIASLEAAINLYANYHFDETKNVRFSERDAFNCSNNGGGHDGCNCEGKDINKILDKFKYEGVVNEECFPQNSYPPFCLGPELNCALIPTYIKCEIPAWVAQIGDWGSFPFQYNQNQPERAAFLKKTLIDNGPLIIELFNFPSTNDRHYVSLVGFDTEEDGDIIWIFKNSYGNPEYGRETLMLGSNSDGKPCIVNSFGFNYSSSNPMTILCNVDPLFVYSQQDIDEDKDGYYNWGIGPIPIPNNHLCNIDLEDSNDDDNRIGPFEEDYSGTPVKPEMNVSIGSTPITNHGFYFFNENPKTITINITNAGTAQLNLAGVNSVTIDQDQNHYYNPGSPPDPQICMNHGTSFNISFEAHGVNSTCVATVKIQLDPCDSDVYGYFEFELVYNGCNLVGQDQHVTGYEDWRDYYLIPNDIYIERGGILEVFGGIAMYAESDIYVEPGGQLIVNGGLITGITGICEDLWHGIDIWGDPQQTQNQYVQGWVSIINGGCIEYAEIAIETAYHPDPRRWYPSGGIISCIDAVFKDNIIDVKFYPFQNTHPVTHEILPNFSRFSRTLFNTTQDFYSLFNFELSAHLYMDGVGGIQLKGCTFGNYSTQTSEFRGKGIESYNAGYSVYDACSDDFFPCPGKIASRFESLDYGIRAFNNIGINTLTVDSVEFNHNRRGIYLGLVENPTIIRCTFDISDPEHLQPNDTLVGLYLDSFTTGFLVEENTFTGPSKFSKTVGIHLLNTGTNQNEIYNNSFTTLKQGIMAVGTNRLSQKGQAPGTGLCIKCNDFVDCNNDVYVTPVIINGIPYLTINTGIAQQQGELGYGDKTKAAGNTFSDVTSYNYFNYTGCGHIDYTYHGFGNPPDYLIPDYHGDLSIIRDLPSEYSKSESCPSHLGGSITLSIEKNTLINETNLIDAYQDTLLMTTDGGNTEGLNYEILTSFPDEALVIRQELIEKSPYLSDTVMISAIEKEDVLPGAMIRDILVSNPQAPKSKNIMNALEQRQDTIPGYMIDEIMQGLDTYGAKELLEQKLGSHMAKKDKAWTNLNLYYKNDTANFGLAFDSLIVLHQNENRLADKYDLVFLYLDKVDSVNPSNILNTIPDEFDLSELELLIHGQYQDLFDILWDTKNDSIGLDSMQIQKLFELSLVSNSFPGIFASNMLIKEGVLNYNETVYISEESVKSVPATVKKPQIENSDKPLKLFPNPAGTYFIAQYDLEGLHYPGIITISDINGKELKTFQLKDKQNQIVIPTLEYTNGIYLVRLQGDNMILDTEKISIHR